MVGSERSSIVVRAAALATLGLTISILACSDDGERLQPPPPVGERSLEPIPPPPPLIVGREPSPGEGDGLAVVVARPEGQAPSTAQVAITFSRPVAPMGAPEQRVGSSPHFHIEPQVPGVWRWIGSGAVELVPDGRLPMATKFTVTVEGGLQGIDGSRLQEPYRFSFETPQIRKLDVEPFEGYRWLEIRPTIKVVLNQPVANLRDRAWLEVEGKGRVGLSIAKTIDLDAERKDEAQRHGWQFISEGPITRYELVPVEDLPLDREVTLVLGEGLASAEGPLALGAEDRTTWRTEGQMAIEGAERCLYGDWTCPYGPVVLWTRNRVDVASLKGKVRFEPEVEVDWDVVESAVPSRWRGLTQAYVVLPGRYMPGTTYRISVAEGVMDEAGRKAPAWEGTVRLDDVDPNLVVGSHVALLEAGGDGTLPVQMVNFPRSAGSFWRLDEAGLARSLATWKPPADVTPQGIEAVSKAGKNLLSWVPVDVRRALGTRTGLFYLRLQGPRGGRHDVMGQLTDLAVHAKLGPAGGLAWVTTLSSGASVPDASLRLYDKEGKVAWSGKTDSQGLARIPGLAGLVPSGRGTIPFVMLAAEKDGDVGVTLSQWYDGLHPYSFGLPADWDGKEPSALGTVFAERGIYRPGDEVHLKGLVRYREVGAIRTPAEGSELELVARDSQGKEWAKEKVRLTSFGTFSTLLALPKDISLGTVSVEATGVLGSGSVSYHGSFRVEAYRAPKFRVDVTTSREELVAGEAAEGTAIARYLFGAAMADSKVRWSLTRHSVDFTPPGHEGFVFGSRVWWWDDETPRPTRDLVGAGDGTTGSLGEHTVSLGKAETPGDRTWEYVFESEVTDLDRQRIAGRSTFVVHPASWYAGIRNTSDGFSEAGKTSEIEMVAVRPDGRRVKDAKLALDVKRRQWKSIRKKGVGGEWFTVTEPVEESVFSCERRSSTSAVSCSFVPREPGLYVAEASTEDGEGRLQKTRSSFYVIGSGWVSWQRNDTDRIDLVADKETYEPGETARILVKSPYPEVEALLTVEREGVMSSRKVRLSGSAQTLEIPIEETMIPNVFVSVLMQKGRSGEEGLEAGDDPGRPEVRVGFVQVKVEKKSKRLTVAVSPDGARKRPGEKVKVDLQVSDHLGRGTKAEVAVWAVDEGVLRLTGYRIPDPLEAVHPLRGLSVRTVEPLIHLVRRRLYADKGNPSGGGGGDGSGAGIRSNFRTTILFLPEVVTDDRGRARVEMELPDNLTTFRIMAMAVTKGDRFGTGQSEVEVAKPLLALPATPRIARVGDVFEAGVVIHAPGLPAADVVVRAEAEGLHLEGQPERRIAVGAGAPVEVRFPFRATAPGDAHLRFFVEGGGERDGVSHRLPILLPVSLEAVAVHGETVGEASEAILPPEGLRPDVGGLELVFSSSALAGLQEGMQQLVEYPYGCLEQEASRLVPFIALREIAGRYGIPWKDGTAARAFFGEEGFGGHPDRVIQDTIESIQRLQNHDGGYRYWPSSGCSSRGGTAYAVLALHRARELGFAVDGKALENGQRFLADVVAAGVPDTCNWWAPRDGEAARVFALWALARSGAPKPSHFGDLFQRRNELPLFARAMLADAIFVGKGERSQGEKVLQELLAQAKESPQEVRFEEQEGARYAALWSSDVRTSALVLQTLASVSPSHPYVPKLARYLDRVRGRDGRWSSTQEAAFALMALTEVSRIKEAAPPSFTAKVALGGKEIASATLKGRSLASVRKEVPIGEVAGGGKLELRKDGGGILYYSARLRYAPAEVPASSLERGFTVQRWLEPFEGSGRQATKFAAGELVRVQVRLATPQERHYAVVEVPLPAGLEVVDTSLATTASIPEEPTPTGWDGGEEEMEEMEEVLPRGPAWAYGFFSPFHHVERRDDRVVLFADVLPAGIHTATVVARATSIGSFLLPPANAHEMYGPEVFGRSEAGRVEVFGTVETAAR